MPSETFDQMDFVLAKNGTDDNEITARIQQMEEFNQIFADQEQTTSNFYSNEPHELKVAESSLKEKPDSVEILIERSVESDEKGSIASNEEAGMHTHQNASVGFMQTPLPPEDVAIDEMNLIWKKTTELLKTQIKEEVQLASDNLKRLRSDNHKYYRVELPQTELDKYKSSRKKDEFKVVLLLHSEETNKN